ncbi:MAG: CsiV family protein [Gammaproteobacteria bacterium]
MRLFPLLIVALLPLSSVAQPDETRYYDVELIVFERSSDAGAFAEQWPPAATPDTGGALDLFRTQGGSAPVPGGSFNTAGFVALPESSKTLANARIAMARSPAYQPLAHLRWRQPGLDAAGSIPIRISGGRMFPNPLAGQVVAPGPASTNPNTIAPATDTSGPVTQDAANPVNGSRDPLAPTGSFAIDGTTAPVNPDGSAPAPLAPPPPEELAQLDGTVRVVLGRYLHVYADLVLRRQMPENYSSESLIAPPTATPEDAPIVSEGGTAPSITGSSFQGPGVRLHGFRMTTQRRMRSSELHYIDHPLMGILVIIDRAPREQASAKRTGNG